MHVTPPPPILAGLGCQDIYRMSLYLWKNRGTWLIPISLEQLHKISKLCDILQVEVHERELVVDSTLDTLGGGGVVPLS